MHTVEKIGGTSMSCFQDVLENIFLTEHPQHGLYQRIFVVSAYSGMTNQLLEHKNRRSRCLSTLCRSQR